MVVTGRPVQRYGWNSLVCIAVLDEVMRVAVKEGALQALLQEVANITSSHQTDQRVKGLSGQSLRCAVQPGLRVSRLFFLGVAHTCRDAQVVGDVKGTLQEDRPGLCVLLPARQAANLAPHG